MFTTRMQDELWLGSLAIQEERMWSAVELDGIIPWFYVRIGRMRQSVKETYMLMLGSTTELSQLVEEQTESMWLEQAYLVSPPHLNNTEHWLMEPLLEVEAPLGTGSRLARVIFKMANGNSYSLEDYPLARLAKQPVIFSASSDVTPSSGGAQR